MKKCTLCKELKDASLFYKRKDKKSGYGSQCKSCHYKRRREIDKAKFEKDPERLRKFYRERYHRTPKIKRKESILRKYGISYEEFNKMLNDQNFRCGICFRRQDEFKISLAIDHCHRSGNVRGLLCASCNRGIGYLGDSPERLRMAIEYLNKNGAGSL